MRRTSKGKEIVGRFCEIKGIERQSVYAIISPISEFVGERTMYGPWWIQEDEVAKDNQQPF